MDKKVKIIGIDKEGVLKLDLISNKINKNISLDKIFPNQDVEKDYVRELLDGVEVLFLVYDSSNKRSIQIASAVDYMAKERKVVSVGINISDNFDENEKTSLTIEFGYNDKFLNIVNMLSKYDTEEAIISIDITDIREIFSQNNEILYDYFEVNDSVSILDIVEKINSVTNLNNLNISNKKQVIFFETNNINLTLENIYSVVSSLDSEECESIFMVSNSSNNNTTKIGIIRN